MGYHGKPARPDDHRGDHGPAPAFPSGGQPTLAVSGLNLLHRFRGKQESKAYADKTDTEIAKEIGTRLGVDRQRPAPQNEPRHAYLSRTTSTTSSS